MAVLYKTDGTRQRIKIPDDGDLRLKKMQELVGGLIELVGYSHNARRVAIGNEEGLLLGLPINPYFTNFVGDILVCRLEDEFN